MIILTSGAPLSPILLIALSLDNGGCLFCVHGFFFFIIFVFFYSFCAPKFLIEGQVSFVEEE